MTPAELPERPFPAAGLYLELVEGYSVRVVKPDWYPVPVYCFSQPTTPNRISFTWDEKSCNAMLYANGVNGDVAPPLPAFGKADDDGATASSTLGLFSDKRTVVSLEYRDGAWRCKFNDGVRWEAERCETMQEALLVAAIATALDSPRQ